MKRLQSIRDLISLSPDCQFCGQPLVTRLIGKTIPNHHPSYEMDFDVTDFYDETQRVAAQLMNRMKGNPQISYTSTITEKSIDYYYVINSSARKILSVDLDSGVVSGNSVDNIQNIFWDHKLVLTRHCNGEACKAAKRGYVCESSSLYLERKKPAIVPFSLETEVYSIQIREKIFSLMSSPSLKGTFLVCGGDLIQELPFMYLYPIKGADVITNKIKTIITFS